MTYDPNQPVSTHNYPPPGPNRVVFWTVAVILAALLGCVVGLARSFTTGPPAVSPFPSWSQVPDPGSRPSPYPQPTVRVP